MALWTANGIANLNYSMAASSGFTAPGGGFVDAAGGATNSHTITMNTSTLGVKNGTLTLTTDAPESPTIVVNLVGEVITSTPNVAPVAEAGPDIVVTDMDGNFAETVLLDGSASFDSDGTIVNYLWKRNLSTIYAGPLATAISDTCDKFSDWKMSRTALSWPWPPSMMTRSGHWGTLSSAGFLPSAASLISRLKRRSSTSRIMP